MYPETSLVRVNYGQSNYLFKEQVTFGLRKAFYAFSNHLVVLDHLIYQNHQQLEKFAGSSILLIGGGPSTDKKINLLSARIDYDFIFSMNNFFFHPILYQTKIDFITIGCGVDLKNERIMRYVDRFNPLTAFELHYKYYGDDPDRENNLKEANEEFYRNDKKICYQTKWYSQLGTGARQLIFAAAMKPSRISFIGFDGPESIYAREHAFDKSGAEWTSQHKIPGSLKGLSESQVIKTFETEYNAFWKYMNKMYPGVEFISLDPNNRYHSTCNYSHVTV